MKRKLVAALLSVAMVASITPVSALGPVAVVEAAEKSDELIAFETAMSAPELTTALNQITATTADSVLEQYEEAINAYAALSYEEKAGVASDHSTLQSIQQRLITVYVEKMETEIADVAKDATVTNTTSTDAIAGIEDILVNRLSNGNNAVLADVENYVDYSNINLAKALYARIKARGNLTNEDLTRVATAVKNLESDAEFINATDKAKALTANYYIYVEAKERLQANEDAEKLIASYVEKLNAAAALLGKEPTEANISSAKALIETADKALEDLTERDDYANYTAAKTALEAAIETAETDIANQKVADDLTSKVNASALSTIELSDMAAIQEIYEILSDLTLEERAKVPANTIAKAENDIDALKTLIPNFSDPDKQEANAEFTEAVIKAFAVPTTADATLTDLDAIDRAYEVLVNGNLLGGDVYNLLNRDSTAYADAVANLAGAIVATNKQWANAQDAINEFTDSVDALAGKDMGDLDYELLLNKAKSLYESVDAVFKQGGVYENEEVVEAYNTLKNYIDAFEQYESEKSDADIIKELVAGIDALPETEKLTISNKDAVYALRDKKAKLSDNGKDTFENQYENYNNQLNAAIEAIDKLVVADLIKQIDALTQVDADASLEEIQAAKAAAEAAREAYDALTDTQKKAVTNYVVLQGAESAVAAAEVQYVKTQMAEISKLDTKTLTVDQANAILAVQEIIAGMSRAQTAEVTGDRNYSAFQKALVAANALAAKVASLENATVTAIADQTYTGEAIQPTVEVKDMTGKVIDASAYKVSYKNNVNAGTATVVISSTTAGGYTGSTEATFTIKAADLSSAEVSGATKTYTGEALETTVKAVLGDKTLTAGTDYEVSYENNTNVGKATITVTGKGNYTGTAAGSFVVKPGRITLTSVTAGSKKLTAKYVGQTGASYKVAYKVYGVGGYKAVYSTDLSKTVTGLKSGTTYKVKILGYVRVDGKTYYTGYGNILKVKVK